MPLKEEDTILNLGTQEIRLVRSAIAQFESDIKWWIYQYRNRPDVTWNSYYCFLEVPFIHGDFEVMSYFACTQGYLLSNIVIVAFIRKGERIGGKLMLINRLVKRNMGGRTKVVEECKTEEERIAVLKEYFGITLTHEQREGIKGKFTELTGDRPTAL
jgi:arylamine N-acetyltransferase